MLGASCLGKGRPGELGQGHGSGREPVVDGVSNRGGAGARGEVGSYQGRPGSCKPGARGWFWVEARCVGGQVAAPAYGRRRRRGAGRREVGEAVSGSFVIFSKSKNQFCKFNFSPSSWFQMKNL